MTFNYEDAIKKLKAVFAAIEPAPAPAEPAAPVAMEALEYKLVDGTPVMIDKIEPGGTVTVSGQPAPDGEHTLEDGTMITTAGGVITEVEAPQNLPGPAPDETDFGAKFAAMEERLSKAEAMAAANEAALQTTAQTVSGLLSIVEQLTKAPTTEPIAPAPGKFGAVKKPADTRSEWMQDLNEALKKIK